MYVCVPTRVYVGANIYYFQREGGAQRVQGSSVQDGYLNSLGKALMCSTPSPAGFSGDAFATVAVFV